MLTNSLLDVRLGAQVPTILHSPPDVVSLAAAEEAIELADAYGICDGNPLAESQKITLRNAGGERADGSWAATRVADFGPRQGTGKNDKIAAWELAHLLLFGTELIIHTAHEFPTANESFLRLVAVFDAWDDLRKKVARIRYANGEQGIELLSGQRLKYRARTGGSGRGFAKAGLLIYDEAQHLAAEHVAASGPAKLANPNAQTWYAGSGGLLTSAVAWQIRNAALLQTGGRLAYTEMTGEKLSVVDGRVESLPPDPTDRDVWYACIPGLGRWVTEEGVEALLAELGPELFAREILCVWEPDPSGAGEAALPGWASQADASSSMPDPVAFAVDVSPDRKWTSIAAAGLRADGKWHLELVDHLPGTGRAVARIIELRNKWSPVAIALDPAGPAGELLADLESAGLTIKSASAREHGQACGALYSSVVDKAAHHLDDSILNTAVAGAKRRPLGDAWAWDRKRSDVDISPLVAVTLARWAFSATPARAAAGFIDLSSFLDDDD